MAITAMPLTMPSCQQEFLPLHGLFFNGHGRNGMGGSPRAINREVVVSHHEPSDGFSGMCIRVASGRRWLCEVMD
jgi:hypothetical protein